MQKIVTGDDRMPKKIAEDLGFVGTVSVGEDVKAVAMDVIANNTDILDHCIREKDNRKLMTIVGKIMSQLNPRRRWDLQNKVGDPVVIKDIVMEALNKRKKQKGQDDDEN